MKSFKNKRVLITGGASGIGKIMVRLFLERGAEVIIWDIDQPRINETVRAFMHLGKVTGYKVDVSDHDQIKETVIKTKSEDGTIDVLINNAGIVAGRYFHDLIYDDITKTMQINAIAPMLITHEFIKDMMLKNAGHICNIASASALLSNPKMSVYASSKWSLVGWSDSLRIEMQKLKKDIGVTTIMPYYINTGMFDGVKSLIPILKPEPAALAIVKSIEKNKTMVTLPGYIYRVTRLSQALLPVRFFDWFAGSVLGIYKTMDKFTGRKEN